MFVVIFEVQPKHDRWDDYLALAKQLRPKLEAIDGFIDNERFSSKKTTGRVLSLSTWRDEKSVIRWRTQSEHHGVQGQGRTVVFEDYHLRVGEVRSDSAPPKGVRTDEMRFDDTETGEAKVCSITEMTPLTEAKSTVSPAEVMVHLRLDPRADGLLDHELFESITNPGKLLLLGSWRDRATASHWNPEPFGDVRHRLVAVIRDYGMFDRREAPQFYPDVKKPVRK